MTAAVMCTRFMCASEMSCVGVKCSASAVFGIYCSFVMFERAEQWLSNLKS